jgi:hypothetical protein
MRSGAISADAMDDKLPLAPMTWQDFLKECSREWPGLAALLELC